MDLQQYLVGLVIGFAVVSTIRRKRVPSKQHDELDRPLLHWSKHDSFTARDLLSGGLLILGITGGAKTSSSGKQVSRSLVQDSNTYGLILAAKPEDRHMWERIFDEKGQRHRLLIFDGQDSDLRFNFLDEVSARWWQFS